MTGSSKLTLADIEAEIAVEHYFNGHAAAAVGMQVGIANEVTIRSLMCLTICVLTLHNGHKAVGINHGPVDRAEFNAELGRQYARDDAIAKLWEPLGFRLRDRLVSARPAPTEADAAADLAGTPRPDFGLVAGDQQAAAPSYDHAEQARRSEAAASVERPDSIIPIPPGVTGVLVVDSQRPAAPFGRIVHYVVSEQDALKINGRRTDGASIQDRILEDKWPCGAQAHIGNKACAGDILPAMVVKVLQSEQVNLQVFLDGNDVFWATTRAKAAPGRMEPGRWHWPARS